MIRTAERRRAPSTPTKPPLLVLLCLCLLRSAAGHPSCLGGVAPEARQLSFCSAWNDENTCCTNEMDAQVEGQFNQMIDAGQYPECAERLKQILCARCDPWAGHLFDYEGNEASARDSPFLCSDFCVEVWDTCKDVPVTIDGQTRAFGAHHGSMSAYCSANTEEGQLYCTPWDPSILNQETTLEPAFPNLPKWDGLVDMQISSSNRWYAVSRYGTIRTWPNRRDVTEGDVDVFLDISDRVFSGNMEQGLLGIALDPDFDSNRHFYVFYSIREEPHPFKSVVGRFTADSETQANKDSFVQIMVIDKLPGNQGWNHNGGCLKFRPSEPSHLYISVGDGGGGGDPGKHGQNKNTWLGSILRIDVSQTSHETPYTIPSDNPFVGDPGAKPEIYAYGFRNPWRFSFDPRGPEHTLWVGDVGQNLWEWVHTVEKGKNYGWNIFEGAHCFATNPCTQGDIVMPVFEYPHNAAHCDISMNPQYCGNGQFTGQSITGGVLYRGTGVPALHNKYVFADYQERRLFSLDPFTREAAYLTGTGEQGLSGFAVDNAGEIYPLRLDGLIYIIPPTFELPGPPTTTGGEYIPPSTTSSSTTSTFPPPGDGSGDGSDGGDPTDDSAGNALSTNALLVVL